MPDPLAAWVALHSVPGMGPVTFLRLLRRFGDVRRVIEEATEEDLAEVARLQPSVAEQVLRARSRLDWAERTLAALAERGVRVLRLSDAGYPEALKSIPSAPPLLYCLGELRPEDTAAAAIVGATRPSERGLAVARGIALRLARAGVTVVSGYAEGVDNAAHLGALEEGGRTVLCLPHGIRRLRLREGWPAPGDLAERGAVLSEQPPDCDWESQAALNRNRLIAALSRAVVVVETGPKGGTMNTFQHALEMRRPVFPIRYEDPAPSARGNAICIARGARPLLRLGDVEEIVEVVKGECQRCDDESEEDVPPNREGA